jgi:hypothetical protein
MKNNIFNACGKQCENILGALLLLLVLLFFCIFMTGCDNFTEVDLPSSQLTSEAVFNDKATANAAMTDIYSKIRDNGMLTGYVGGLSSQLGLYADELVFYGSAGSEPANFYTNSLQASGNEARRLWNNSYSQIYAANSVIEGVGNSTALLPEDKNQLMGEALFVRALLHFYLANVFGEVPYIRTTDYQENRIVHRMPEDEVYILIKADLEQAVSLLPEAYIGAERVRPNKWAAIALLARVNLYMGAWDEASNAASAVINQTGLYIWPTDIEGVFGKDSMAAIWQLMPANGGDNTHEAETFVFAAGPPPASAISSDLFDAFADTDLRKTHWIGSVTDGTDVWYFPNKYKESGNTGSSLEYSIVLRLAEQYLIRAEARAHQGDLIGAKEDLNVVRNLAGLPDTVANTSTEIIDAVLQERRLELFTEFGHRFFDLKRTGHLDAALTTVKPQWDTTDRLLPIPESELLLNPNLAPQNAGY